MAWINRLLYMRNQTKSNCSSLHRSFYSLFWMKEWMIVHNLYIHLLIINHLSQDIKTISFFFLMKGNPIYKVIFCISESSCSLFLLNACKCPFYFPSLFWTKLARPFLSLFTLACFKLMLNILDVLLFPLSPFPLELFPLRSWLKITSG